MEDRSCLYLKIESVFYIKIGEKLRKGRWELSQRPFSVKVFKIIFFSPCDIILISYICDIKMISTLIT